MTAMALSLGQPQISALEKKPTEKDLDNVSKEVGGGWMSLLVHLGVPMTKIESFKEENQSNTERTCFRGLVYWTEGNEPCEPATWSVLLKALEEGAEKREYAEKLRKEIEAKEAQPPEIRLSDNDPDGGQDNPDPDGGQDNPDPDGGQDNPDPDGGQDNPDPDSGLDISGYYGDPGNSGYYGDKSSNPEDEGFVAACQNELKTKLQLYTQAARYLVQHRDTGMAWFREAADDLDVAFKRVAAAKIAGSGLGIVGGVLSIVGGGLILGGVTAPAGIPILVIGAALGVGGGITGVGATIGDVVKNRKTLKQANEWLCRGRELCKDLIETRDDYCEKLDWITKKYCKREEEAMKNTIGYNNDRADLESFAEKFQRADNQALLAITEWKKALEVGAEATATAFVAGTRVAGAVTRGVVGGVEAGAEAGAAVARVAVQAAGGVVIGLSAVFMVVDLALIGKTAYDVNKNKKGTELAKKLRQAADDMEEETAQLQPLSNLVNDI